MGDITQLIHRANGGEPDAWKHLLAELYEPLKRLARARLGSSRRSGTALDTTGLVHEFYLRLQHAGRVLVNDREHFMAYAARAMRSVIVDFARARSAARRGGDQERVTLQTDLSAEPSGEEQILSVHRALEQLEAVDPRLVRVVEMRYFAGMTEPEIGQALGVTDRTVRRDWEKARLLLAAALRA